MLYYKDPIRELKKLNRNLMTQYLQLLQTLVENPQEVNGVSGTRQTISLTLRAAILVWAKDREYQYDLYQYAPHP